MVMTNPPRHVRGARGGGAHHLRLRLTGARLEEMTRAGVAAAMTLQESWLGEYRIDRQLSAEVLDWLICIIWGFWSLRYQLTQVEGGGMDVLTADPLNIINSV